MDSIANLYYKKILYQIVITDKSITVIPTTEIGLFKVQSDCIVFI